MKLSYDINDLIVFLLIHASYADLEFTDEEKRAIIARTNEKRFEEIFNDYNSMGDYQRLAFIQSTKDELIQSPTDKSSILALLEDHFYIDGVYSRIEKTMYRFLEKWLELT